MKLQQFTLLHCTMQQQWSLKINPHLESLLPALVLNTALLPVNARRLWEIRKLTKETLRTGSFTSRAVS